MDITNFVKVNIKNEVPFTPTGTRVPVFITAEDVSTYVEPITSTTSISPALAETASFAAMFFNNGGKQLKLIKMEGSYLDTIKSLDDEYILISCDSGLASTQLEVVEYLNTLTGSKIKILAITSGSQLSASYNGLGRLAVKYSTHSDSAHATIAAYLSQVDVNLINSVNDYAFTEEQIVGEIVTSSLFEELKQSYNVASTVQDITRNFGGNSFDGISLVNEYVLVILQQELTSNLFNLLTTKIKIDNDGLASSENIVVTLMSKYLNNGFLNTNTIYEGSDLSITKNGVTTTLLRSGEVLSEGYSITILPLTTLTAEDRASRKLPDIYLFVATSEGVREINVVGEVI